MKELSTAERNYAYDRAVKSSGGGTGFDDAYAREIEALESEPTEAEIQAALDYGRTVDQHLCG